MRDNGNLNVRDAVRPRADGRTPNGGGVGVVRPPHLAERIVIVDGLPGCGKTMMTSIVGGLERLELVQYAYPIEYACALRYLGKIDEDAAQALIRMFTDLQLYNAMMSRETNFRWGDLSGVRLNPKPWRSLRRLFQSGDAAAVERIRQEKPILHLVTHLLLGVGSSLLRALGERVCLVEVVRHPLYMIKQQYKYMSRWGTDVRDFSIWFDYDGRTLPWFVLGWEEKFIRSNPMDQAIAMIEEMHRLQAEMISELTDSEGDRILIIPFERFVCNPWPYLSLMEDRLGTKVTGVTRRALKNQNVPRERYADGILRPIYRRYGWEPPRKGSDEAEEFLRRREFAAEYASPGGMKVLDRLCAEYERKYLGEGASVRGTTLYVEDQKK